jgi:tRNA A-37 threonylcarbamoyl transferase component Bud32
MALYTRGIKKAMDTTSNLQAYKTWRKIVQATTNGNGFMLCAELMGAVARTLALLHDGGLIHGSLQTSHMSVAAGAQEQQEPVLVSSNLTCRS